MRSKIILTLLVIALCLPQMASAQLGRWGDGEGSDLANEIRRGRFTPFIEANWGVAQPGYQGLAQSFASLGVAELKFGFTALDSVRRGVSSLDERYAFGSYFAEDVSPMTPEEGDINTKLGRFGVGNRLGYGWGGKVLTIEMYNQNSINWNSVEAVNYEDLDAESQAVFDRYGDTLRYGQLFEAGVKVNVFRTLSVTAGVEGAIIFPRTVFWEWAGSAALYSAVQGAVQFFTAEITKSSSLLGPLLNFGLKSAVSAAYYYVSRDDMNWPFDSETPLTMESAKLGLTLDF